MGIGLIVLDLTVEECDREPGSCVSEGSAISLACVVGIKHCE